jgi:UDP-glucuronate decarboxylase
MGNIQDLLEHPNFTFIYHDVINPIEIDKDVIDKDVIDKDISMGMDIKFKGVEQIYNLACPASPKAYQYDSIKTLKTNFLGTLHVLGLAKRLKARVLLTSTSEIYGDPHINPQVEEYWGNVNPIGLRSCYDEGKRVAETLMMEYHKNHHVDIRIARIFNTYGPFMNKEDGRVVSNFINQMLENKNITIYGDGNQTRSFCYIQDTVNGLVKLMNNNETIGPINIGNPHEITVHDLVTILFSMIHDTKSKIIYEPLPSDDPHIRRPDISKAEKFLDWTPIVTLNEGLKYTIAYFQNLKI